MKQIDFLPEIYTQNRVQRRARRWWCLAAAAFAVVVLLAAATQWMVRHGIERDLAAIEPKYAEALQRQLDLQRVRAEIERAEEIAALYSYLAHPWPRSQLLAHIIRPIPDSVRLTEIAIAHEVLPAGPPITSAQAVNSGSKQAPSPASADLMLLRTECDGRQAILSVSGTTTTMTELHAYVEQLGKSPLIAAAHLKGVEAAVVGNAASESRFHLHVVVRPGYGQEGGPEIDPVQVQSAGLSTQNAALGIQHAALGRSSR